jgi:hypothetical protein
MRLRYRSPAVSHIARVGFGLVGTSTMSRFGEPRYANAHHTSFAGLTQMKYK